MRRRTTFRRRRRIPKSLRVHHDRLHDQLVPLISWIRTGGSTSLAIIITITTGRSGLVHALVHVHEVEIATERGREKETRTNVSAKPQVINTRATGTVSATGTGTTNTEVKTKKEIERGGVITRRGVIEIDLYLATAGGDAFS